MPNDNWLADAEVDFLECIGISYRKMIECLIFDYLTTNILKFSPALIFVRTPQPLLPPSRCLWVYDTATAVAAPLIRLSIHPVFIFLLPPNHLSASLTLKDGTLSAALEFKKKKKRKKKQDESVSVIGS